MGNKKVSLLLYADDIVFVADMQQMLTWLHDWCKRWRVLINTAKSKSVQFRTQRQRRSEFIFKVGENIIETVESYKYLGVIFHEQKNFKITANALASGAGRALGGIISKIHNLKEFGFNTSEKLYTPVLFLF